MITVEFYDNLYDTRSNIFTNNKICYIEENIVVLNWLFIYKG
jgi:hypothetical protein